MDLKNVKSWQIAGLAMIVNFIVAGSFGYVYYQVDMRSDLSSCEFGCGFGVVLLMIGMLSIGTIIIGLTVVLLRRPDENQKRMGAISCIVLSITWQFLVLSTLDDGLYLFLLKLPGTILFSAGIYYFLKKQ